MELTVTDMTCGRCAAKITQAIVNIDPNAHVETDVPAHRVQIDSSLTTEALLNVIRQAGYTPTVSE